MAPVTVRSNVLRRMACAHLFPPLTSSEKFTKRCPLDHGTEKAGASQPRAAIEFYSKLSGLLTFFSFDGSVYRRMQGGIHLCVDLTLKSGICRGTRHRIPIDFLFRLQRLPKLDTDTF